MTEAVLVREMVLQRALSQAGLGKDVVQARGLEAVFVDLLEGSVQNLVACDVRLFGGHRRNIPVGMLSVKQQSSALFGPRQNRTIILLYVRCRTFVLPLLHQTEGDHHVCRFVRAVSVR